MPDDREPEERFSVFVYQASGMMSAQLCIHPTEALMRMQVIAHATAQTVDQVAFDIINRIRRFDGPSDADNATEIE